ncbi:hypothetical protein ACP70R_022484 [Stipagrostis hirtigluma subsp. patula]
MLLDLYASHIQAFPGDAELIGKEIPNYLAMHMLFVGGVCPGSGRRRRRTSANPTCPGPSTTAVQVNGVVDEDDDFVPPRRSCADVGGGSRDTTRGRPRTTTTANTARQRQPPPPAAAAPRRRRRRFHATRLSQ